MVNEHIYLVYEQEFFLTTQAVYRIGCVARDDNDNVLAQENLHTILLLECNNSYKIMSQLFVIFNQIFKRRTDIGRGYYEGDSNKMLQVIITFMFSEDKNEIDEHVDFVTLDILNEFPDIFMQDKCFGGTKELVKIKFTNNQPLILPYDIECSFMSKRGTNVVVERLLKKYIDMDTLTQEYFDILIKKEIIQHNQIYNFDATLVSNINSCKTTLNNCIIDEYKLLEHKRLTINDTLEQAIKKVVFSNTIINNIFYTDTQTFRRLKIPNHHTVILDDHGQYMTFVTIGKYNFHHEYLMNYIPYCCETTLHNEQVYILNLNKTHIGLGDKNYIRDKDFQNYKRTYFFSSNIDKWTNIKQLSLSFKQFIHNKKVINYSGQTRHILKLLECAFDDNFSVEN
uniref:Uncharacterized protein n=1 Tax=Pyramimonas orientalis virus TaxID=455367 RepID=A0A7M3UPE1_POV01|nr:hypothetical protein HWQ62_00495 [Pyramimonas orientalis virus]